MRQRSASSSSFSASQPPMLARPSFLADIVMPSASEAISRTMSGIGRSRLARLAQLDEPGVLGEAAGVEEQRHAVAVAHRAHGAQVLQRDRLAAARVVGDRHEHDRHVLGAALVDAARSSAATSMLPLNGWIDGGSRPSAITRSTASAPVTSTLARVVSKWVLLGTTLPGAAEHAEQDLLGRAALVGRDHVPEREQVLDRLEEAIPGRRAGVALVAVLDGAPTGRGSSRRCRSRSAGR